MTDAELLAAFESATVPCAQWDHRAHVRTAWLLLGDSASLDQALTRMREGLRRLNAAQGTPENPDDPTRGYHETITRAYLTIIDAVRRHHEPQPDSGAFCDRHTYLTKQLLLLFYSRARIMSPQAKAAFIEPDLLPLPE